MSTKTKKKAKSVNKETTDEDMSNRGCNSEDMATKFEQELVWCIEQLQLGLETQNASSRQAVEATKTLKILLSSKAPLIKKRQVMSNTFGDYRKKMAEMERKSSAAVRKVTIAPVASNTMQKSTYFKKSATRNSNSVQHVTNRGDGVTLENHSDAGDGNSVAQSADITTCSDLNTDFQFNFKIDENKVSEKMTSCPDTFPESVTVDNVYDGKAYTTAPFVKSDNSFRFNFTPPS